MARKTGEYGPLAGRVRPSDVLHGLFNTYERVKEIGPFRQAQLQSLTGLGPRILNDNKISDEAFFTLASKNKDSRHLRAELSELGEYTGVLGKDIPEHLQNTRGLKQTLALASSLSLHFDTRIASFGLGLLNERLLKPDFSLGDVRNAFNTAFADLPEGGEQSVARDGGVSIYRGKYGESIIVFNTPISYSDGGKKAYSTVAGVLFAKLGENLEGKEVLQQVYSGVIEVTPKSNRVDSSMDNYHAFLQGDRFKTSNYDNGTWDKRTYFIKNQGMHYSPSVDQNTQSGRVMVDMLATAFNLDPTSVIGNDRGVAALKQFVEKAIPLPAKPERIRRY